MGLICEYCNKEYSSYSSRSNHIKKYHSEVGKPKVSQSKLSGKPKVSISKHTSLDDEIWMCRKCNKEFKHKQSRFRHEKSCSEELKIEKSDEKLDLILNVLKSMKIHPKKLEKINKDLMNINNGTININTINNNFILPYAEQNLKDVLNDKDKMKVLQSGNNAHLELTNLLYQKDDYKQYRNVYITNMSNDIGYIYDDKQKRFIIKSKKNIIYDYGIERFSDIEEFYQEMGNKMDQTKLDKLKELVHNYFNDTEFQHKKNKELLISLYNNKVHVEEIYKHVNELEL